MGIDISIFENSLSSWSKLYTPTIKISLKVGILTENFWDKLMLSLPKNEWSAAFIL